VACLRTGGDAASAELIERRHLTRGYDAEADPSYADVIEAVLEAK
jgi:hypothetical protein